MTMFENFTDLRAAVAKEHVKTVEMTTLRNLLGAARLGPHVVAEISNKLDGLGISHYPADLPQYQEEKVRLFVRGTPVAEIIEAVLGVGEENDQVLRDRAESDSEDLLRQIRMLVCD